jgi:hypothetical protein
VYPAGELLDLEADDPAQVLPAQARIEAAALPPHLESPSFELPPPGRSTGILMDWALSLGMISPGS